MMRPYLLTTHFLLLLGIACTFTKKVQTGMQAFEVKQYAVATQLLEREYSASKSRDERAQLAFYAGESYGMLIDPSSAAPWYYQSFQDGFGPQALERYAQSLKQQEKYSEAILVYEELLQNSPGNAGYRSQITLCRQAMDWKNNANTAFEIMPVSFNTSAAEYAPQPIGPGLVLFTSDRDSRQSTETYLWTGRAFSDLYVANINNKQVLPFDARINTSDNEGTAVISADGAMLAFTRCYTDQTYDAWCKIMISYRRGNAWSDPVPLPFMQEKSNYGHPAFTANGTTLFFASDAPGGQGGHDIYFSQRDANGTWLEPLNLGSMINTMGEEQYPTVYKDTLYFSSDHHAGLGGLDIFKTWQDVNHQWVPPINLRAPINSGGDDFGFVVDTFATLAEGVLQQGYFTSSRSGPGHYDDIFAFSLLGDQAMDIAVQDIPQDLPEEKPVEYQIFLSLRVVEPMFEISDDPNSKRIGQRPLPNGPVIVSEGTSDQRHVTGQEGQLLLKLDWNKQYRLTARYRDHLTGTYELSTSQISRKESNPITTINHIIELDPIFRNIEIELDNIFYDYEEWVIRDDARPALNHLTTILKNNPTLRIQLTSHTDCRGTDEYNLDLSQKRAQAAIDYLMSQGIAASRLTAVGLGETQLAIDCACEQCTEDEHQANRRTTFKITD